MRAMVLLCLAVSVSCVAPDERGPFLADVEVRMEFASSEPFGAPFPSEHRRNSDGSLRVSDLPNPQSNFLVTKVHELAGELEGFSTTSPIHFTTTGPIAERSLPQTLEASVAESSGVALIDVDPNSPTLGRRQPIRVQFEADGGPYGAPNMLSILPAQGFPLRPSTLYAAVVTTALETSSDSQVRRSDVVERLASGLDVDGLSSSATSSYQRALETLAELGVDAPLIAGLSIFRTGDPLGEFRRAVASASSIYEMPSAPTITFEAQYADYCTFRTSIPMPVFQSGTPPYTLEGGNWGWDQAGQLVLDHEEVARIELTIPRRAMPPSGYPLAVFIRAGAGADFPLSERGRHDAQGMNAEGAGSGPARELSQVGIAGISVDGPHTGPRNVSGQAEDATIINVLNPAALRDNLRQSALEIVLLARSLDALRFDSTGCTDASPEVRFDVSHPTLIGHSLGATIAPLVFAVEPRFSAMMLGGAGASWIENILWKKRPLELRPAAAAILGYSGPTQVDAFDPAVGLYQWATESADTQVYAPQALEGEAARHVFVVQGVLDNYIPPPVANALTLPLGVELAGESVDARTEFTPLEALLPLAGRSVRTLPIRGNLRGGGRTGIVTMFPGDGIEDAHEVMFQRDDVKAQMQCFLRDVAAGLVPEVPALGVRCAP
jgi:hypothetical protein